MAQEPRPPTIALIEKLKSLSPGVERDLVLFYWKHKFLPKAGLFSTAHGGDCAGSLLAALEGAKPWPETAIVDGKTVTLEYEVNFNRFTKNMQTLLETEKRALEILQACLTPVNVPATKPSDFLRPGEKYLNTDQVEIITRFLHEGQTTKTGKRYFGHSLRVKETGIELFDKEHARDPDQFADYADLEESNISLRDKVAQTCLGHDTVEDQKEKANKEVLLAMGMHPHVVDAIDRMTKRDGEPYLSAIERAKANPISRIGKMADNTHNSKLSRVAGLEENVEDSILRHTKYLLSYMFLSSKIDAETFRTQLREARRMQGRSIRVREGRDPNEP